MRSFAPTGVQTQVPVIPDRAPRVRNDGVYPRAVGFVCAALAATFMAGAARAAPLPFDPEAATQAWLATMGPEATARSNAYFEGGYWLDLADSALNIVVAMLFMVFGFAKNVRA